MFSSALKSFTSNISSNYTIAPHPNATSGPWKIFEAKKKSTGKPASVFVFDKKSLDPSGSGLGGRSGSATIKRAHDEVLDRLKKEANSLARLRHPSILELVEPVEETRSGGLMFATEPVTASLAGFLAEKDEQETSSGVGGRGSKYGVENSDGQGRKRSELQIDELEIQKGLLQMAKGLEFLHQSAGLVHGNITPEAIFVNAKSDWKISGLAFSGPPSDANSTSTMPALALSEVLNHDPRLPRSVQLNLDYTSPDFVLDNNVTASADMFSLGLLIVALYNTPHRSPLDTNGSLSAYKRTFSSSSTVPTISNNFLSAGSLPNDLASDLLPRLITRRPAQRLTATDFQQAHYFDNILVSTIRFLDALPAKSSNEKAQFMRGLPRIVPQFPKSVLEKKVLPALLEEMKDRDLLPPILQNVFAIVKTMPSGKRTFTEKVTPRLREIFLAGSGGKTSGTERDAGREAGLMVVLENMSVVAENCSGKEFRDDILPIIALGLTSQTHSVIDASLSTLSSVLPVLDYSTIKNDLFPVITNVFAHTSSLAIKVRGLEAFYTLCGGTEESNASIGDGLDGVVVTQDSTKTGSNAVLDKYTVQEKVVPLLKAIKTKEPGVMMAALKVFRQVGKVADSDFLAMEVLPILWSFSLGPLLDLQQFQAFMALIKSLSSRIEREQTRKLQELTTSNGSAAGRAAGATSSWGAVPASNATSVDAVDFESLVSGRKAMNGTPDMMNDWGPAANRPANKPVALQQPTLSTPTLSWATTKAAAPAIPQQPTMQMNMLRANPVASRTVTPDQNLNTAFAALTPSSPFTQPLQPNRITFGGSSATMASQTPSGSSVNWSAASNNNSAPTWASQRPTSNVSNPGPSSTTTNGGFSSFSIPLPPMSPPVSNAPSNYSGFNIAPPPNRNTLAPLPAANTQRQGLEKYESLL